MPYTNLETRLVELLRIAPEGRYRELAEVARAQTRVTTGDASGVSSDGASLSTSTYEIDLTTADVLLPDGVHGTIAALTDEDLLAHANACDLDGQTPAAMADGYEQIVAVCAINVSGAPALAFVFGDAVLVAATPVAPTPAQCRRAIGLAGITGHTSSGIGLILGEITITRNSGMTLAHSDPASDDDIKAGRLAGALV